MTDFAAVKSITIPEGIVTKIVSAGVTLWEAITTGYKNWVSSSTEADGKTIYNGGLGYKNNTRLNSSAVEVTLSGYVVCGYIPAKAGDTVRVKGITWDSSTSTGGYFWTFDSSYTGLKYKRPNSGSSNITVTTEENGVIAFYLEKNDTAVAYIRFSAYGDGTNLIVTVNENI